MFRIFQGNSDLNFFRLGKCEVCAVQEAKYTCPKCEVKTCQLACLKIHKKELECDGLRDKTKYIPLKKMTKMDFMSDYNFLEECTRYVQTRKCDRIKCITRFDRELPAQLYRLRAACRLRRTTLRFLLPHFTRHKSNTTKLDLKSQIISWKIEWNFPIDGKNLVFSDEAVSENEKLSKIAWKYLDQEAGDRRLEYYQAKGFDGVSILLKAEGVRKCHNRFFELDPSLSLKQNLADKTVVEYPVIYVVTKDLAREFDVIESDEDLEPDKNLYERMIGPNGPNLRHFGEEKVVSELEARTEENKEVERKRKWQDLETKQKNLLFTDESYWDALSESEDDEAT